MWLRRAIGKGQYARLDPSDSGGRINPYKTQMPAMRELIRRFEERKKRFSTTSDDVTVDLPPPLDRLTIEGRVRQGELTIYRYDFPTHLSPWY